MRSRTSCFNLSVFGKSVKRFWPLWTGYLLAWVLLMPVELLSRRYDALHSPDSIDRFVMEMGLYMGVIAAIVMGVFAAMAVWGFLYNARSAQGMACLPLRREGLWLSSVLAGLVPVLAANLIVLALSALAGASIGWSGGILWKWFCAVSLSYLFFYSFATLCAQLTGSIVILPLVYGVLNLVAVGAEVMLSGVFAQFVYGLSGDVFGNLHTRWFSPPVGMILELSGRVPEPHRIGAAGWRVLLIYAAAGLVLLAGSLLLFRRRRMETAGDVVAVRPLKPVFRWCMAIGSGMVLSSLMYVILFLDYGQDFTYRLRFLCTLIFLLLGALIGWFAGEMLIRKSFRAFSGRRWAGLGVVCAVILVLMLGMRFDLFGVERRIPATERVEAVVLHTGGASAVLREPESIEQARQLHQAILDDKDYNLENRSDGRGGWGSDSLMLRYELKNGGALVRAYSLRYPVDDPRGAGETGQLQDLLNCPEAVRNRKEMRTQPNPGTMSGGYVNLTMTARECAAAAGYEDVEDYILIEQYGMNREQIAQLSETERREAIVDAVQFGGMWSRYPKSYEDLNRGIARYEDVDYDAVWFSYSYSLSASAAWSFYESAVRPDLEDGALGKVYIIEDGAYERETYAATLWLYWDSGRDPAESPTDDSYGPSTLGDTDSLNTLLTADACRTADWLRARGLVLHTPAELSVPER